MLMDLSWSVDFTKLLIGSFVHTTLFSWNEVNVQLSNYNMFVGDPWLGSFLNRLEVLQDSVARSILVSFINDLWYNSPLPFFSWIHTRKEFIRDPLSNWVVYKFGGSWELLNHALVDPHGFTTSFPLPADVKFSAESATGFSCPIDEEDQGSVGSKNSCSVDVPPKHALREAVKDENRSAKCQKHGQESFFAIHVAVNFCELQVTGYCLSRFLERSCGSCNLSCSA
ncbi:hypothetical protein SUGI_1034940 [Cryptomeria japonica]|nr:hypothetical protein SUGI_1034940 [Cryptomeria japonica]